MAAAINISAFAQSPSNAIEKLVVTAEKRDGNLQDVPVVIAAPTQQRRKRCSRTTAAPAATSQAADIANRCSAWKGDVSPSECMMPSTRRKTRWTTPSGEASS